MFYLDSSNLRLKERTLNPIYERIDLTLYRHLFSASSRISVGILIQKIQCKKISI